MVILTMDILKIRNLNVEYYRGKTVIPAVRGLSLDVARGETLSIVGESGSGKSTLAMSILRLIFPEDGKIVSGEISFEGKNILELSEKELETLRGKEISTVFQDPFSSLNPVMTIERQLMEALEAHNIGLSKANKKDSLGKALREVMFNDPERILRSYPHQLSGGQRQRVVMAMAIINKPKILIADEPTTALDVTIQKEIMDLLEKLRAELDLTLILITHNLLLAGERSDRIAVMNAGEIVELAGTKDIFQNPKHPYTASLMRSVQTLTHGRELRREKH
jgi:ABC-type dipeptide/oligopeptide/nickel transport system ATPase component